MLLRLPGRLLLADHAWGVGHRLDLHRRIAYRDLLGFFADLALFRPTALALQFGHLLPLGLTAWLTARALFSRGIWVFGAAATALLLRNGRRRRESRLGSLPGSASLWHRQSGLPALLTLLTLLTRLLRPSHAPVLGVLVARKFKVAHHAVLRPLFSWLVGAVE